VLTRVKNGGFAGGYWPLEDATTLSSSQAIRIADWRVRRGSMLRRFGVSPFADVPNTRRIIRLYAAVLFGVHRLLRFDQDKIYVYDTGTNAFTDISGVQTWLGSDEDVFAADVWLNNTATTARAYFSNGIAASGTQAFGLYYWENGAASVTGVTDSGPGSIVVPPAKWIIGGFADRVFLLSTLEGGAAFPQRIRWCVRGNDSNWSGTGAGALDLADDPYPITGAGVTTGRAIIWKGDQEGGSIYVGTKTGVAAAPVDWQILNPGSGIGCFAPLTIQQVSSNIFCFLGHDDIYLFDGTSLRGVGGPVAQRILRNYNHNAQRQAWSVFDPLEGEYELVVPLTNSTSVPSERYIFNTKTGTWHGFESCAYTSGTRFVKSLVDTWDTAIGSWDSHTETWDQAGTVKGEPLKVYGDSFGVAVKEDPAASTDSGVGFTAYWTSRTMTFEGVPIKVGRSERVLQFDDFKCLRSVTIVFRDKGQWTPVLEVSTDNGSTFSPWTTTSQSLAGDLDIGRITFSNMATAQKFVVRIGSSSSVDILDVEYEVEYAGAAQYAI
jgi:hypothetical protein